MNIGKPDSKYDSHQSKGSNAASQDDGSNGSQKGSNEKDSGNKYFLQLKDLEFKCTIIIILLFYYRSATRL